eukprot:1155528-Pelagomonas_calceolata.AAC.2
MHRVEKCWKARQMKQRHAGRGAFPFTNQGVEDDSSRGSMKPLHPSRTPERASVHLHALPILHWVFARAAFCQLLCLEHLNLIGNLLLLTGACFSVCVRCAGGCNQLQHWALHFHGRGDAAHGGLSRHIPGAANEGLFRDLPEAKLT